MAFEIVVVTEQHEERSAIMPQPVACSVLFLDHRTNNMQILSHAFSFYNFHRRMSIRAEIQKFRLFKCSDAVQSRMVKN